MKKTIIKLFAIIGAIAAAATLIFIFRDKILALLKQCPCCKKQGEACDESDLEGSVEAAIERAEEKTEEVKAEVEDFVEDAAAAVKEQAEAIAEEFKDYADVEPAEEA